MNKEGRTGTGEGEERGTEEENDGGKKERKTCERPFMAVFSLRCDYIRV